MPNSRSRSFFRTTRDFHACKQEEGQSVSSYVLRMKGYIENLERLGHPVTLGLAVSLILIGIRKEFDGFVQNYNMHSMGKTVNELHAMLKLHEQTLNLPKNNAPALHAIRAGKVQKGKKHNKPQPSKAGRGQNQGNGKHKHAFAPKPKIPPPPKSEDLAKDSICHEYGKTGHWKRNCPQYLAELLKKKKNTASGAGGGSGIFVIELNTFLNRSWIYDTGCGTHICNTTQGLRASRKLKPGALSLYVGNGQREAVEAIGNFDLSLPSGLVIVLNNCHYAPSITRGVISVSRLYEDGFINRFVNNTIQVSRNNMVYFSAIPRDGIFEIDLSNSYTNENSIYTVSNKRAKLDLDSALLWHCRLGHISKKRIEKLQHDGLLNSTNLRDFEKCVPCMSGKMARKPYTHQVERAKDLLGLIHTDCFCKYVRFLVFSTYEFDLYVFSFNAFSYEVILCVDVFAPSMKYGVLPTKKVEKTPYERIVLIDQEASGSLEDLVILQRRYASFYSTSLNHEEDDRMCLYIDAEEHELGDLGEPANYKAALLDPESDKWLTAMNVEMQSMKDNEVWIFDIRAIRIPIAIAAYYDYEIWQMDVKTAFLNGYLNEEVYMEQPEGFVNPKYPNRVCKLKRSIYGLKQASRQWNKRFDDEIKKFGFSQNADEPCVYLKPSESNVTFLILYVDNILIMGNNIPMLQDVKSYLGKCFAMKDLGEAAYILGIKIYRDRSRWLIGLYQSAYIEKILKRFHMENSKRGSIPMQEKLRLSKSQGASTPAELKRMQNVPYASAVGSIMNTKDMFLVYGGNLKRELRVSCYTDAGYLTDADDLKSQTGYVFILNEGVVDWKSAKQSIFATSSTKAEYIAAFDASKEAVWVRKFISRLGVVPTIEKPINMYCDNTRAIAIANESRITKGARHFRAKVHYLREVIEFGDIKLEKVHTDENLVDPFTKALAFPKHSELTRNIGMLPSSSLM
ncbi:retrotransposon protein, putative, ty1-copia subclass [Tanacetum coccineum]